MRRAFFRFCRCQQKLPLTADEAGAPSAGATTITDASEATNEDEEGITSRRAGKKISTADEAGTLSAGTIGTYDAETTNEDEEGATTRRAGEKILTADEAGTLSAGATTSTYEAEATNEDGEGTTSRRAGKQILTADEAGTLRAGATTSTYEAEATNEDVEGTARGRAGKKILTADEAGTLSAGTTTSTYDAESTNEDEEGTRSRRAGKKILTADEAEIVSAGATTTSTGPSSRDFEVFFNFRGPDSRSTVVNVLHDALDRAGIRVFYDDESIRKGEVIEGELMEAITNAKIYILVFSVDYASSKWCLRELAEIMKRWEASRKQEEKKMILPIFHGVHVSKDLKLRSDVYTTALGRHREVLRQSEVKPWESALRKAAAIKGWNLNDHGLVKLAELVVDKVCSKLWIQSDPKKVPDNYVGIDGPMDDITNLLDLDAPDVRFITIFGIGGAGKTTLARLVYKRISSHFGERVAFLSDVSKKYPTAGVVNLQKDLISQLLHVNSLPLTDTDEGVIWMRERLRDKKVLIVLDDLEKKAQLLKLVGETSWFCEGSRIIITTRNIGIIFSEDEGFYRYKMKEMKPDDALKLFSKLAFNTDSPPEEIDDNILREAVKRTGGNPRAINAIAHSFGLNNKDEWGERLERLKKEIPRDVMDTFKMSYDHLDDDEKEIFLDIACLFISNETEDAFHYWKAKNHYPNLAISVLRNFSLIEIVDGNKLWMHDLVRDFGRKLADKLKECRRLWSPEEALRVVQKKKGTQDIIALKLGKIDADCCFNHKQFAGLTNMEFLELNGGDFENGDFSNALSKLRWLCWDDCPSEFQATNLSLENLAVLMLSKNLITDDRGGWGEIKAAEGLKVLKCSNCRFRMSPEFSAFPDLERLIIRNSSSLRGIGESICKLANLTYLEITNPAIFSRRLVSENVTFQVDAMGPQILPDSLCNLRSLLVLKLKFVNLFKLPDSVGDLTNLRHLCLWCPNLRKLPESVGNLKLLVELDISYTAITRLPGSLINLESLNVFKGENCQLKEVPGNIMKLLPSDQLETIITGHINHLE